MAQRVKMNSSRRMSGQLLVLAEMETSSAFWRICRKVKVLKREMNMPQHLKFSLSISRFGM